MKKGVLFILFACLISACSSPIIDGYTDRISYFPGDSLHVFLNAETTKDYRMTISDANGNTVMEMETSISPQTIENDKPYQNGYGYDITTSLLLPELKSGLYFIEDKIPFIVKSKTPKDIVVLYSSNTENAYCKSGGKSLYDYSSSEKIAAQIVSFHRPIKKPFHSTEFYQWLAKEAYDVSYICDQDLDDYQYLEEAKLIVIPGHSEYWTREARLNFDRFVDSGNDALILSGNTMWWQVRYDRENMQLICYKNAEDDPVSDPELKTITWPDTSLHYSVLNSIGSDFNYGGFGKKEDNGWDGYKFVQTDFPFLAEMHFTPGEILPLESDECDGAPLIFSNDSSEVSLENPMGFFRYELVSYDLASRKPHSNQAWVVMQKTAESGTIINVGSTNWTAKEGMTGEHSETYQQLTRNMIDYLLAD